MIEVYINFNQLYNFLYLKEPVTIVFSPISDQYVKLLLDMDKVHLEFYRTYTTVELLTFRKKVQLWMRKFKRKK
jgi:hypothetical protein